MHRTFLCSLALLLKAAAVAQTAPSDSQTTQTLLSEIRQLRQDLQTAAVTIQRVQIVMYRLQAQAASLDRATQRLDQVRGQCRGTQEQRKMVTTQIEKAEAKKRNSQNSSDQANAEELLSYLKSSLERWAGGEQQCQAEQIDAEGQFRAEQVKMSELEDQLEKLDRSLAGFGRR